MATLGNCIANEFMFTRGRRAGNNKLPVRVDAHRFTQLVTAIDSLGQPGIVPFHVSSHLDLFSRNSQLHEPVGNGLILCADPLDTPEHRADEGSKSTISTDTSHRQSAIDDEYRDASSPTGGGEVRPDFKFDQGDDIGLDGLKKSID